MLRERTPIETHGHTHARMRRFLPFSSARLRSTTSPAWLKPQVIPLWPHVRPPCRPGSRKHGLADPWRPLDAASALRDVASQGFYAGADSLAQLKGRTLLCQEVHLLNTVVATITATTADLRTLTEKLPHALTHTPITHSVTH
jgi:hypothetical protein